MSVTAALPAPGIWQRVANALYLHPRVLLFLLLAPPLAWLGVIYLGSLFALLLQSLFYIDEFSGMVVRKFSLATYGQLFTLANLDIILRTSSMAAAVSVAAALLAFPLAYYMARYATTRVKAALYLGVMLPLWSSYLVRVYSWKLILAKEGIVTWLAGKLGLTWLLDAVLAIPVIGGPSLSTSGPPPKRRPFSLAAGITRRSTGFRRDASRAKPDASHESAARQAFPIPAHFVSVAVHRLCREPAHSSGG